MSTEKNLRHEYCFNQYWFRNDNEILVHFLLIVWFHVFSQNDDMRESIHFLRVHVRVNSVALKVGLYNVHILLF